TPPVVTVTGRGNRWRDGAIAFVALAVVLVGAATLWPRASVAVDRSSPAPAGSVAVVAQATPAPTATPTAAPTRTSKPTAAPTAVPTAAPAPAPTPTPTVAPTATPTPKASPKATAKPTAR